MLLLQTTQSNQSTNTIVMIVNTACLQAVGAGVQSAQLMADRDRAVAALDEATKAAAAAQQDAARYAGKLMTTLALSVMPPCLQPLSGSAPEAWEQNQVHGCARH